MDISTVKDILSITQYLVLLFFYPVWKSFKELNETLKKLNETVKFLETIVLDIADDRTIARATRKIKLEDRNGASDNK